jgi:hypothetical protein
LDCDSSAHDSSAHSWRLALSALELIDLGLQALKFQALCLE